MLARLTHLDRLEAEAIHIFREVAATFANPVMLYSVGKDSSVLLHLAMKAFYPAKPPFPLPACRHDLEVPGDDRIPRPDGQEARLRPARPHQRGRRSRQRQPVRQRLERPYPRHEDARPAPGAGQVRLRRGFRRGAARRGEVARQGAHLFVPQRPAFLGPEAPAAGDVEDLQHARRAGRVDPRLPVVQLDRTRHLAVHPAGRYSDRAALFRQRAAGRRARRHADHARRRPDDAEAGRGRSEDRLVRFRTLGCYPADGSHRIRRRHARGDRAARC